MKYLFINTIVFCIFLITACNKQLVTTPTQDIPTSAAFTTNDDVQAALVGTYAALGNRNLYGGRIFLGPDLLANTGEVKWSGTYQQFTQINIKAIPIDNLFVENTWLNAYTAINDANNVLSALGVLNAVSKDRVEGEAKFIRGSVYFDLVRVYAKAWNDGTPASNAGVPIVLTPTTIITNANKISRKSVAEVYAQAIKDLTEAEAKLPASNGFYATKFSAAAMLARIYLQQGDYANAAAAANRVIVSKMFTLAATYAAAFPTMFPPAPVANTMEDVFAIQVNASSGVNGYQEFYSANGRADITINPAHLVLYEMGDDRKNLFYTSNDYTYTGKFDNLYGNVHIIRLAEMYLTRAEANFRLGTTVGDSPLNDVNVIRERALLPDLSILNLSLARIIKERKLELAFEGFSLHDAKRLKNPIGVLPYNSPKLVYPIPKREMIVNNSLTQNEGYF